jgi:Putative transposase/Transposase zinc-binding domain
MAHAQAPPHPHPHTPERLDSYARRRPEDTVLYQTIDEHWAAFSERLEQHGGLPRFVAREFEEYLKCGLLDFGFLELECRQCGHTELVALSCKRRGFCPSCLARRMSDSAAHLERSVLPEVPIRHWICSFPWGVRAVLGYDAELCARAASAFASELMRSLRRRAKKLLGLGSVREAFSGAVVAIQRTDSALRLNVHLHVLALDGAYVREPEGALVFHALPTPSSKEVADIARRTAQRLGSAFQARGRPSPWQPADHIEPHPESVSLEQPGLFACHQAAAQGLSISGERAGLPALRLVIGQGLASEGRLPPERPTADHSTQPVAEALGISVYAKQLVDGRDRRQLERLCRYITRPPLALERLSRRADGRLELELKSVWKDGTRAVVLEPHDLLVRLCAAVPPPRLHLLRYFGILSSHHALRSEVTPSPAPEPGLFTPPPAPGDQQALPLDSPDAPPQRSGRARWGWLIGHVFLADVEHCTRCGGPMRWVEVATSAEAIARLLAKHGLAPRPPPPSRSAPLAPGQLDFAFARAAR